MEKFTPYLDPALWRIRARLKVDDNEEYKAPWTPWQSFLVGRPNLHLFDKKQDKLVLDPDLIKKLLDASQAAETRDRGPDRDNAQKPRAKVEPTKDQQINIFDQKPIDLSRLKGSIETWIKIKTSKFINLSKENNIIMDQLVLVIHQEVIFLIKKKKIFLN